MIYDDIFITISGLCLDQNLLTADEILVEEEMPNDPNQILFARFVWTYGDKIDFLNNNVFSEIPTLAIEFFERSDEGYNDAENIALQLRNLILRNHSYFSSTDAIATIQSANILKLGIQENVWRRINLILTFNMRGA